MTSPTITSAVGKFVWHELMTSDVEAAKRFYTGLFGWTFEGTPMAGPEPFTYWMAKAGEEAVGGFMDAPKPDMPPNWLGYVLVDDVDATTARATAAGGQVVVPPRDIPGMGRFSVLLDPQGAVVATWKTATPAPAEDAMPGLGEFCWDQLSTTDVGGASAFYARVFGWTPQPFGGPDAAPAPGTEAMVVYHRAGGQMASSAFPAPANVPSHWQTFVAVADLAKTRTKTIELGGKVWMPEIAVPGMGKFAVLGDPQGAVVCAFEGLTT